MTSIWGYGPRGGGHYSPTLYGRRTSKMKVGSFNTSAGPPHDHTSPTGASEGVPTFLDSIMSVCSSNWPRTTMTNRHRSLPLQEHLGRPLG